MSEYLKTRPKLNNSKIAVKPVLTTKDEKHKPFEGLKKGFLNSKPKTKTKQVETTDSENTEELPFIRANSSTPKNSIYNAINQISKEDAPWLTDDFLKSIEQSKCLSSAFNDPYFLKLMASFPQNPKETFEHCQKQNPKYLQALKEFSNLLGTQFNKLADQQQQKPGVKEVIENSELSSKDKQKIQQALDDKELREAMQDIKLQRLIHDLKNGKQVDLQKLDADLKRKVFLLVQNGFLAVQN